MKMQRKAQFTNVCRAAAAATCSVVLGIGGCGELPEVSEPEDEASAIEILDVGQPEGEQSNGDDPAKAEESKSRDLAGVAENNRRDPAWAEETYPATWGAVQAFVASQDELRGRSIARVTPLYRPDVEGPAYLDMVLQNGSEEAGHVIASTGGHDVPIYAWSDTGLGVTGTLESMHQRDLGEARIFVTGIAKFVAEIPDGSLVTSGAPLEPEAWAIAKDEVERFVESDADDERITNEWERIARVGDIALPPDVVPMCPVDGCGGDPCMPGQPHYPDCMAPGAGSWNARGADRALPPNYYQFDANFWDGYCPTGCTPTAFSIIAGWISHQAGDHRDGSPWGHPRMAYAYDNGGSDTWAPQTLAPNDNDPTEWRPTVDFRSRFGTNCVFTSGSGTILFDDRVRSIAQQYFNDLGAPITTASLYNASWESYYGRINSEIQAGRPVEVNALDNPMGDGAHSWVVWGYRKNVFGEWYGVNLGWSGTAPTWVSVGSVLGALTPTSGLGEGIVMFRPATWRDHGPLTTGAGSNACVDVGGWDTNNGAVVHQYTCHGGDNQAWSLERTPDMSGWWIRNRYSGRCLAVWDGGGYDGARVTQWTCDPNDANIRWGVRKIGARVAIQHHASNRCLDLDNSGGMGGDGKALQVWGCHFGANQQFDFQY